MTAVLIFIAFKLLQLQQLLNSKLILISVLLLVLLLLQYIALLAYMLFLPCLINSFVDNYENEVISIESRV